MIQTTTDSAQNSYVAKYFIAIYLLIDFARIQDLIPIGFLRPGMIIIVLMALYVASKREYGYQIPEFRLIWFFLFLLCLYIPFARNGNYAYKTAKTFAMFFP